MLTHAKTTHCSSLMAGLLALGLVQPQSSQAQGCVASRGSGGPSCSLAHGSDMEGAHSQEKFQATVSYRWFRSERMFSGDSEDSTSDPQINRSQFIDLSVRYSISPRYGVSAILPYSTHDRSQLVRRLNIARTILGEFHTKASGLGDIRLRGDAWLLDPMKHMKGNVQVGVGLVLPTGDEDAQSTFAIGGASTIPSAAIRSVDPSIQPGSGGYGIALDLYGYQEIIPRLNGFISGSYTFTPEEDYAPTASSVAGYTTYSITDSYNGRLGLDYLIWSKYAVAATLAGRIEGVPVSDPIGGSAGFRRPGYSVSIEPGINASWKSWSFGVSAPVAVYRNRLQNKTEEAANTPAEAAGFADYQLLFNVSKRF